MIRSILVALDGSDSSFAAAAFALALAKRHRAHVEGLAMANAAWIQYPEPTGGTTSARARDLARLESPDERLRAVLASFDEDARRAEVSFEQKRADGDPVARIAEAAHRQDLIVLGKESLSDLDAEMEVLPLQVERIVRDAPRPVMLVPGARGDVAAPDLAAPLLVAFDGSAAASRTLHMLALLGLAAGREVQVLSVDESEEAAAATAERAGALLLRHGVRARCVGLGDRQAGTPAEAILGTAKAMGAGMIATGAYGTRGIREMFGSCTRDLLTGARTPLFLHH